MGKEIGTKKYFETQASEAEFEKWYRKNEVGKYKAPSVTADIAIFTYDEKVGCIKLLLTKRNANPYRGFYGLPGTFVRENESVEQSAQREVEFETGLKLADSQLKQVKVFSEPNRDPRGWTLSVSFVAFVPEIKLSELNQEYSPILVTKEELKKNVTKLAFDHSRIVASVIATMQQDIEFDKYAFGVLKNGFALKDAKKVYESFSKKEITTSNFKKVFVSNRQLFVSIGKTKVFGPGRPSELYKIK